MSAAKRRRAAVLGAVIVWSACAAAPYAQASDPGPWAVVAKVPLAAKAWRWNWASWDQEKIVTHGHYQYTVFWDADRTFVLARRDLRDNSFQLLRLAEWRLSADDPHRNTCLGVSPEDGRLHFSWDHHNNPLNYARTRHDFLTEPPEQLSSDCIEARQPRLAPPAHTSRATYPRFLNDAQDRLFLFYRQGQSGNGENYLCRYRAEDGTWSLVGKVFSSRGTYGPWEVSNSRNAYLHDLLFDAANRLHATWVYREVSGSWASNHDLHYAFSDDGGRTWQNNAAERVADLTAGDPIELDDSGIVVRPIPVFSWMMNAGCMALDSRNRPHVLTFKLPSPQRPDRLSHDPPPAIRTELCFVHYWRAEDGTWHGGEPIAAQSTAGSVARGDIVFGPGDTLYFYWADRAGGRFHCLEARAHDHWQQWGSYPLLDADISGADASKHDRVRWADSDILSFTARFGEQGFGIVDLKLQAE